MRLIDADALHRELVTEEAYDFAERLRNAPTLDNASIQYARIDAHIERMDADMWKEMFHAALHDLYVTSDCLTCEHMHKSEQIEPCKSCGNSAAAPNYHWRGMCKENKRS